MQYRSRCNILNSFGNSLLFGCIYKGRQVKNIGKYLHFYLTKKSTWNIWYYMIKRITVNSHTYNNYMTYQMLKGTGWLLDYLTTHTSLSTIRRGFAPSFVNYKKGCTRLATESDKVYQLLAHCRWFLRVFRLLPPLKLVAII